MSLSCEPWCAWQGDLVVGVHKIGKARIASHSLQYVPPIGSQLKFDSTGGAKKVLLEMLNITEPVQLSFHYPTAVKNKTVMVTTLSATSPQYTQLCTQLSSASPPRAVCGLLLCPGNVKVEVALLPACADVHSFGLTQTHVAGSGDVTCKNDSKCGGVQPTARVASPAHSLFVVFVSNGSPLLAMDNYVLFTKMLAKKSKAEGCSVGSEKQVSRGSLATVHRREKDVLCAGDCGPVAAAVSSPTERAKQDLTVAKTEDLPPKRRARWSKGVPLTHGPLIEVGSAENTARNLSLEHVGVSSKLSTLDRACEEKSKLDQFDSNNNLTSSFTASDEEARGKSNTSDINAPSSRGSSSTSSNFEIKSECVDSTADKYPSKILTKEKEMRKNSKSCKGNGASEILDQNKNIVPCKSEDDFHRAAPVGCAKHNRVTVEMPCDRLNENKSHVSSKSDTGCQSHAPRQDDCKKPSCTAHCEKCGGAKEFRGQKGRDRENRHRKHCPRARKTNEDELVKKSTLPIIKELEEGELSSKNSGRKNTKEGVCAPMMEDKRTDETTLPIIKKQEKADLAHKDSSHLEDQKKIDIKYDADAKSPEFHMPGESKIKFGDLMSERNEPDKSVAALPQECAAPAAGSSKQCLRCTNTPRQKTRMALNSSDASHKNSGSREYKNRTHREDCSRSRTKLSPTHKSERYEKSSKQKLSSNSEQSKKTPELFRKSRSSSRPNSSILSRNVLKEEENGNISKSTETEIKGRQQSTNISESLQMSKKSNNHLRSRHRSEHRKASDKRSNDNRKISEPPQELPSSKVVTGPQVKPIKDECSLIEGFRIVVRQPVVKSEVQNVSSSSELKKTPKGNIPSNPNYRTQVNQTSLTENCSSIDNLQTNVMFHHSTRDSSDENSTKNCEKFSNEKSVDSGVMSISEFDGDPRKLLSNLETNEKLQTLLMSLQLTEGTFIKDSLSRALKEMNIPEKNLDKLKNMIMLSPAAQGSGANEEKENNDAKSKCIESRVKLESEETDSKSELVVNVPTSKPSKIKSSAMDSFKESINKVKKLAENFSKKRKTSEKLANVDCINPIKKLKAKVDVGRKIPDIVVEPWVQSSTVSSFCQNSSTTDSGRLADLSSFDCRTFQASTNEWRSNNAMPRSFSPKTTPTRQTDPSGADDQGEPLDLSVRHNNVASELDNFMSAGCTQNYMNDVPAAGFSGSLPADLVGGSLSFTDTCCGASSESVFRNANLEGCPASSQLRVSKSFETRREELSWEGRSNNAHVYETIDWVEEPKNPISAVPSEGTLYPQSSVPTMLQQENDTQPNWPSEPLSCEKLFERDVNEIINPNETRDMDFSECPQVIEEHSSRNLSCEQQATNVTDHGDTSSLAKFISCMRSLDRKTLDQHAALLRNDESVREGLNYLMSLMNNSNMESSQPSNSTTDQVNIYIRSQLDKLHGLQDKNSMSLNWNALSSNEHCERSGSLQGRRPLGEGNEAPAMDLTDFTRGRSQECRNLGFADTSMLCSNGPVPLQSSSEGQRLRANDDVLNLSSCHPGNASGVVHPARVMVNKNSKPPLPPCGSDRVQLLQRIAAELQSWPCQSLQTVSALLDIPGPAVADNLPTSKFATIFMPSESERLQFQRLLVKLRLLFRPVSYATEGQGGLLLLLRSTALPALLLEDPWASVLANPDLKVYTYETFGGVQEESLAPRLHCGRLLLLHHTALLDSRFGTLLSDMSRDNLRLQSAYHLVIISKASLRRCIALALRSRPSNLLEHRLFCSLRLNLQLLRRGVETGMVRVVSDVGDDSSALPMLHRSLHCRHRGVFLLTGARCPAASETSSKFYRTVTLSTLCPSLETKKTQSAPFTAEAIRLFGWNTAVVAGTSFAGTAAVRANEECLASGEPQQFSKNYQQRTCLPVGALRAPVPRANTALDRALESNYIDHNVSKRLESPSNFPPHHSDPQSLHSELHFNFKDQIQPTGSTLLRDNLSVTPQPTLESPFLLISQETSTTCQSLQSPSVSSCKVNSPENVSCIPADDVTRQTDVVPPDPLCPAPCVRNISSDLCSAVLNHENSTEAMQTSDQLNEKELKRETDENEPVSSLNETQLCAWQGEVGNK